MALADSYHFNDQRFQKNNLFIALFHFRVDLATNFFDLFNNFSFFKLQTNILHYFHDLHARGHVISQEFIE